MDYKRDNWQEKFGITYTVKLTYMGDNSEIKDKSLEMKCIFCNTDNEAKSIEHIVSESFGNKSYKMEKGKVCDECNSKFSKFEKKALSNSVFIIERARFGIESKKGVNAKGKVNELTITGHPKFLKQHIFVKGLTAKNFRNYDPKTKVGELFISSFDKSEVATSKLLLKIGLESLYKSRKKVYEKYNFDILREFLLANETNDWPFILSDIELQKFESIPRFTDKHELKKVQCTLKYLEVDDKTLLFRFKYGGVSMTINLLNRKFDWILMTHNIDKKASIYPIHVRNKILKQI